MLIFSTTADVYLMKFGAMNSMHLYPHEMKHIEEFCELNSLDYDLDDEEYLHVRFIFKDISTEHPIQIHSAIGNITIRVPVIHETIARLPASLFENKREGDLIKLKFPITISEEGYPNPYILAYVKLNQLGYYNTGGARFEEVLTSMCH